MNDGGGAARTRVRIVGGSIAGLFAAILLDRQGFDVRIYERSGSNLSGRGAGLTGGRELFDAIRSIGCSHVSSLAVVSKRQIILDRQGRVVAEHDAAGARFSWDLLYRTARSKLPEDKYVQNRHVSRVLDGDDTATIVFDDNSTDVADLVIGADGIASVVREAVNPLNHENRYAGYAAWRILLPEADLPNSLQPYREDLVGFSEPGIQSIGYMVPGAAGEVSPGGRRYSWGWYRGSPRGDLGAIFTTASGRQFEYSLPPGGMSEVRVAKFRLEAASNLPPQFAAIASARAEPWVQGIFDYTPRQFVGRRIALVGDAAALARPHVGLGTSKAAGDAVTLADAVQTSSSIAEALQKYEQARLPSAIDLVQRSIEIGISLELSAD
ncbi:FAD-dependent monooxygenase [Paraburkholderia strydomiana]|uniref:FAD binding domain-containing protein n=1 Tax=Paraburkholderia strydomiana TaxID=1245417 RepID=UPI0038B8C5F2